MKTITKIFILFIAGLGVLNAQHTAISDLNDFNPYIINPAIAGVKNCQFFALQHKKQWTGIDKAPTSVFLSGHMGLNKKMGIGGSIVSQESDVFKNISAAASYSYHHQLNNSSHISGAVGATMASNTVNMNRVNVLDQNDAVINGRGRYDLSFTGFAAVLYGYDHFRAGLTVNNLYAFNTYNNTNTLGYNQNRMFTFYADYDHYFDRNLTVKPMFVLYNTPTFTMFDIGGVATVNNIFNAGLKVRSNNGVMFMGGMHLTSKFQMNFSYQLIKPSVRRFNNGNFEFMLAYKFCRRGGVIPNDRPMHDINTETIDMENVMEDIEEAKEKIKEVFKKKDEQVVEEVKEEVVVEKKVEAPKPIVRKPRVKPVTQEELDEIKNHTIVFEINKYYVENYNDIIYLQKVADVMERKKAINITIVGHSCNIGSKEANQKMALKRAEEIKSMLDVLDVDMSRVKVESKGETAPKHSNKTEEGRKLNRRVEILIN